MPNGDKNIITQSTLNDFITTRETSPNLTHDELLEKFPEFDGSMETLQVALDYDTTSREGKHETLEELNSKFPEFFEPKKKELTGKGLQQDWESLQKYEVDHPKFQEFDPNEVMAKAAAQAQAAQQEELQVELPAEVQEAEAGLPTEQEQLDIVAEVNPEEVAKIEAEEAEVAKIEVAKQQKDTELSAQARVYGFTKDYKSMLEEGDQMGFESVKDYSSHFKDAAAKQFLMSDGDEKEYQIRSELQKLEKTKRSGAPIGDEQIQALRNQADAARAEKYRDIDKSISEIRDQLATGIVDDKERNALIKDIKLREDLKKDVFETDPAKLAKRAAKVINEDKDQKILLANVAEAMPEGLSGKEKFDRYYNVMFKRYRDLSEKLGFEVGEKGMVADPLGISEKRATATPFMALKSATGTLSRDEEELLSTLKVLERLSPTYLLNQSALGAQPGFWSTFWDNFGERLTGVASAKEREQTTARGIQEVFATIGVKEDVLTSGTAEAIAEVGKDYTYDDWEGSKKRIAMLTSTILDIGIKYSIGGGVTNKALNLLGKTKLGKNIAILSKEGKLADTSNKFYKALSKAPGVTKFTAKGLGEGLKFEGAGQIFRNDQDELNFMSGFLGSSVGTLVKGAATPLVNKIFGMFGKATPKAVEIITNVGSRGAGELAEETTQELYQVYKETDNYKEFKKELEGRFGKTSDKMEFIISSMLMGSVFGSVNTDHVKDYYNNEATPAEKAIIDEVSQDMVNDISQSVNSAVDETTTKEGISEEKSVSEEVPVETEKVSEVKETPTQISSEEVTEKVASVSAISETKDTEKEVDTEVSKLEKPIQDIDIKEEGNYDKVISYLKNIESDLDEFGKETLGMNLPVALAKTSVVAIRKSIEGGKVVADAIKDGVRVVAESEWYKNLNKEQQTQVTDQFAENLNKGFLVKKPKKKSIKAQIKETVQPPSEKVVTTEKKLLKDKFINLVRGAKIGAKGTKESIKQSVIEGLEPLKGKLTKTQTSSIMNKATSTNFDNPSKVAQLQEHVDKVVEKSNYVEDLKTARTTSKKLKKAVKGKKVPIELEKVAKQLATIPVNKIDSIEEYNEIANAYNDLITGKSAVVPKNVDKLFEKANKEVEGYNKRVEANRLRNEYEGSELKNTMSFDDFKDTNRSVQEEFNEDAPEKKKETKRTFLEEVLPDRINQLKEMAKDEDLDLDPNQKRTLGTLSGVDISDLTTPQLVELNNILTSILEFDSFSRVGDLETFIEANKRAPKFEKYEEKLRSPSKWFTKYMTTTAFIKSLVVGGRSARSFIKDLIGELDIVKNKAVTKSDKFNQKVKKAFNDLSIDQNRKLGMISFVVQTQGGTIEEINAEFENRKKAVLGTVEALTELGKKSKKISSSKIKRYNNKAEKIAEAYNEYLTDANTPEEAIAKLNEKEKAAYDMLKEEFAKIKDDLADSQARYNGKEFVEYTNYLPTEGRPVGKFMKDEFSLEDPDAPPGANFVDTRQAGTTIERQEASTTGDTVYNFDLMDMVKRKYYESVYDIETLRERKVINRLINNPKFKKALGSDIHPVLVEKIQSMITTQKRQDYNASIELPKLMKGFAAMVRLGKRVKLSTVDQVLKQPIPVLVHTAIYNNPKSVGRAMKIMGKVATDQKYKDAFNKLFAGSDAINRVLLGDTVLDREMRNEFEGLSNNDFMNKFGRVREAIAKATSAALVHSDNAATKISLLSSYLYELEKQGIDTSNFDLIKEAENINEEAISQANGRTDDINNISDFSKTADLFKSKSGNDKVIRELFWNFKSFSLNAGMNAAIEIRNLLSKDATRDEKFDSFKFIVGYMAQQTTFNALKIYVVNILWDRLADALFGGEDKEETDEEKIKKLGANTGMELIGSLMPSLGEEITKDALNQVYLNYKKGEWEQNYGPGTRTRGKKPPKPTKYTDKLFYVDDGKMLGSYTIPYDLAGDITETLGAVASGKEFSKTDYLKLGSTTAFLLGIGDLDRLFSKAYWRLKRKEKSDKSRGPRR